MFDFFVWYSPRGLVIKMHRLLKYKKNLDDIKKSGYSSPLTDRDFRSVLRIPTSKVTSKFDALVKQGVGGGGQ